MRKIIFVLVSLVTGLSVQGQMSDDYVEGYEDSHCEGYRSIEGEFSVCPYAPFPSYPDANEDTYKGGYRKGFREGRRTAEY